MAKSQTALDEATVRDRRASPAVLALTAGALGVGAVLVALWLGGGRPTPPPPGIPSAGGLVEWGLPVVRITALLTATFTVGLALAAAVLLPSQTGVLSRSATRALRVASVVALVWAVASIAQGVFVLADVLALPLTRTLQPAILSTYLPDLVTASSWVWSGLLALVFALVALLSQRTAAAFVALGIAIVALLPPAATGHAAVALNHDLAVSSLVVHVAAVALWIGGLMALVWYSRVDGRFLGFATRRFSPLALVAYIAVGLSGIANALVRIPTLDGWMSGYGALVLAKVVAFVALGWFGWWHRTHTMPAIERGEPGAFARFAAVEAAVMVIVMGIAVALSRTPSPEISNPVAPTQALDVLGFSFLPAPTALRLIVEGRPDSLIALTLLALAVGYLIGVRRLRRRGDRWPVGRTAAWFVGIAILAVGTLSGFATYGRILFDVHMAQHMMLSMLAPIFLVLAAPITLALRALPPAGRDQPAGPREWLLAVLHSKVAAVLTHPVVAFALFVTAPYIIYFSDLFQYAMFHHWAHLAMHVHFVLVGYLFYESVIGIDPLPRRASYPLRLIVLFISLPFHAFFAVALMGSTSVIAATYYGVLGNPYGVDLIANQSTGSALAWGFGELPMIVALIALLIQWSRDDTLGAQRSDRQADRDGDAELVAYNAMLASRDGRDRDA